MIWSHYGPNLCYLDFSRWHGGWDAEILIVDWGYVVLPYARESKDQPGESERHQRPVGTVDQEAPA